LEGPAAPATRTKRHSLFDARAVTKPKQEQKNKTKSP